MDEFELRQNINRVTSGYTFLKDCILDIPSAKILAQADNIYLNTIYENRFDNILDRDQLFFVLIKNGLWSLYKEEELKNINPKLDRLKLELYRSLLMPSKQKRMRTEIEKLKNKYNQLMSEKLSLDYVTLEYLAEKNQDRFIISKITLDNNYELIDLPASQIDRILEESKKNNITIKNYREIARSNYWQNIWAASGLSTFRTIGDNQRYLIMYTNLYENINKHPECPPQEVVNDDDMLDGWIIHTKQEYEQHKKQEAFEKTRNKSDKIRDEQFIMANNKEDIESIMSMNDTRGKLIQAQIHAMAKKDGVANEFDIPEIQQNAKVIQR